MAWRKDMLHPGTMRNNTLKHRFVLVLALVLAMVWVAGCGGGGDASDEPTPLFTARILSDQAADGDIAFSPPAAYAVSSALVTGNILAGIDPGSGDEFRGFLDFPLRGPHGVPSGANIESATLEIFINSLTIPIPDNTLPLLIDLVSFQPPALISSDFDRQAQPPLLSMPFDLLPSDEGAFVVIDVTALMDEAQIEGLPDFQLRLLLDFFATAGLVEIDDAAAGTAPLLTVTYFFP
jgi:hypothetical protein